MRHQIALAAAGITGERPVEPELHQEHFQRHACQDVADPAAGEAEVAVVAKHAARDGYRLLAEVMLGLGLEAAGVILKRGGAVAVDDQSQSSVPSIFAIGDVTDRVNLTPVAIREGHAFADREFGKRANCVRYDAIPTAVFATPEIGTVGLSEAEARVTHAAVDIYKSRFRPMKATLGQRSERMLMKLVVDAKTQKMLGVHILGADAAEMVQIAAIALRLGATKADFDATMALHPSAAEELVTMRDKWVAPSG